MLLILRPYVRILLLQRELLSSALLCSPVPSPPSVLLFPLSLLPLLLQSALSCLFPALNRLHYTLLLSISSKTSKKHRQHIPSILYRHSVPGVFNRLLSYPITISTISTIIYIISYIHLSYFAG